MGSLKQLERLPGCQIGPGNGVFMVLHHLSLPEWMATASLDLLLTTKPVFTRLFTVLLLGYQGTKPSGSCTPNREALSFIRVGN